LIESAVNVGVTPEEFANQASNVVEVDRAIEVLHQLGFDELPQRIPGKTALQENLEESLEAGIRLTPDQIVEFNRLIAETAS
jgi:hypothetical protein